MNLAFSLQEEGLRDLGRTRASVFFWLARRRTWMLIDVHTKCRSVPSVLRENRGVEGALHSTLTPLVNSGGQRHESKGAWVIIRSSGHIGRQQGAPFHGKLLRAARPMWRERVTACFNDWKGTGVAALDLRDHRGFVCACVILG